MGAIAGMENSMGAIAGMGISMGATAGMRVPWAPPRAWTIPWAPMRAWAVHGRHRVLQAARAWWHGWPLRGTRIGEAAIPGPSMRLIIANVTSWRGSWKGLVAADADVYCIQEARIPTDAEVSDAVINAVRRRGQRMHLGTSGHGTHLLAFVHRDGLHGLRAVEMAGLSPEQACRLQYAVVHLGGRRALHITQTAQRLQKIMKHYSLQHCHGFVLWVMYRRSWLVISIWSCRELVWRPFLPWLGGATSWRGQGPLVCPIRAHLLGSITRSPTVRPWRTSCLPDCGGTSASRPCCLGAGDICRSS